MRSSALPAYEGMVDLRKNGLPFLLAGVGIIIIFAGNDLLGFLLIVAALLYSALRSDADMHEKTEAY